MTTTPADQNSLVPRLKRELKTIEAMIGIYCQAHHGTSRALCNECCQLLNYAEKRLNHCPFQADKPTCGKCTVHCYKPAMQENIRRVMRYSGPRMIYRHPILAFYHLLDSHREPSELSTQNKNRDGSSTSANDTRRSNT